MPRNLTNVPDESPDNHEDEEMDEVQETAEDGDPETNTATDTDRDVNADDDPTPNWTKYSNVPPTTLKNKSFKGRISVTHQIKRRKVNGLSLAHEALTLLFEVPHFELEIIPDDPKYDKISQIAHIPTTEMALHRYTTPHHHKYQGTTQRISSVYNISSNMPIDELKDKNPELKTKLGAILTWIEPHPYETDLLREVGIFPFLHPRLTNIRRLELCLKRILKGSHRVEVPFTIYRKNHRFGTDTRVQATILALKCEEENVTILRDAVSEIASKHFIGSKATFLPHGLIHKLGREKYKNILIEHNKYCNSIKAVTMYDVEEDALKETILGQWTDEEENVHKIVNYLSANYDLIAIEHSVQDGKVFFLTTDKIKLEQGLEETILETLKCKQQELVPSIKSTKPLEYENPTEQFVFHVSGLATSEPQEVVKQYRPLREFLYQAYQLIFPATIYPTTPRQEISSNTCGIWMLGHIVHIAYNTSKLQYFTRQQWKSFYNTHHGQTVHSPPLSFIAEWIRNHQKHAPPIDCHVSPHQIFLDNRTTYITNSKTNNSQDSNIIPSITKIQKLPTTSSDLKRITNESSIPLYGTPNVNKDTIISSPSNVTAAGFPYDSSEEPSHIPSYHNETPTVIHPASKSPQQVTPSPKINKHILNPCLKQPSSSIPSITNHPLSMIKPTSHLNNIYNHSTPTKNIKPNLTHKSTQLLNNDRQQKRKSKQKEKFARGTPRLNNFFPKLQIITPPHTVNTKPNEIKTPKTKSMKQETLHSLFDLPHASHIDQNDITESIILPKKETIHKRTNRQSQAAPKQIKLSKKGRKVKVKLSKQSAIPQRKKSRSQSKKNKNDFSPHGAQAAQFQTSGATINDFSEKESKKPEEIDQLEPINHHKPIKGKTATTEAEATPQEKPVIKRKKKSKQQSFGVVSLNANGIPHQFLQDELSTYFESEKTNRIELYGFSEPNLNWSREDVYKKTQETFRLSYLQGNIWTTSSPIQTFNSYKPGGILLASSRLITSRTISKGKDYLGRWAWTVNKRDSNRKTCILQAYMPTKTYGLFTVATQQYQALLRQQPSTEPQVQLQFQNDLKKDLHKITADEFIIMGDFNLSPESEFIRDLQQEFSHADVIHEKLGHEEAQRSTYKWGRKRLDHLMAS